MVNNSKECVFLVDNEPLIYNVAEKVFGTLGAEVRYFLNAADCLKSLDDQHCDLLITDVELPDADGVEFISTINELNPRLPVLVVTAHADIPTAVAAVKAGALDVMEKPLDENHFRTKTHTILKTIRQNDPLLEKPLSKSEMRILELVVDARSNKEIAHLLHRSVRTVEVHRSHIMQKLGVNNLVDLVKTAAVMGLVELPAKSKRRSNHLDAVQSD